MPPAPIRAITSYAPTREPGESAIDRRDYTGLRLQAWPLAHEPVMPNVAISLHAPTDWQREALVPITKKYPIAKVLEACRRLRSSVGAA
jgi:hypothetical protein